MTTTTQSLPLDPSAVTVAAARPAAPWLALACATAMVLACGPLLWKFFVDLWARPQYEFFPLLLAAIPFIAFTCLQDLPADTVRPGRPIVGMLAWCGALACLAVGGVFYLKWFAPVAAWLTLAGVVWMAGGWRLVRALWPVGVLLLLVIPPPGHSDEQVLVALRQMAVACAGRMLDLLGVPVYLHGAVIDVPGDRLMVEEACSGINSMLAVLAFTVLLAFWKRLPAWSLLMLLPAAFVFVFWANVARITVCAAARVWWDLDLLKGTPHDLLGIALFVGCMALVFSTERLGARLFDWDEPADAAPARPMPRLRSGGVGVWAVFAVLFVATGTAVGVRTWDAWPQSNLPSAGAFVMPDELAGWTLISDTDRSPGMAETSGRQSRLWQYRRGATVATLGVDYPFSGYHEATTCYALAGWNITGSAEVRTAGDGPVRRDVTMRRPPLSQGTIHFALCDEAGRWWRQPAGVVGESFIGQKMRFSYERATLPMLAQLQLLSVGYDAPTPAEQAVLRELFDAAAERFRSQVQTLGARR